MQDIVKIAFLTLISAALIACDRQATAVNEEPPVITRVEPTAPACDPGNAGIELPAGFCAMEVHPGVGAARHIAVATNGDIYVAIRNLRDAPGGIIALRDTTGDGKADMQARFHGNGGTGIAIHDGHLYFGEDDRVLRWRLDGESLAPGGEPEVVVSGLLDQRSHAAKSIALDGAGNLFVNIGAPSNSCQEVERTTGSPGRDPCPLLEDSGGVWRFDAGATGLTQADGERYASGIRNAVAIAWDHGSDGLFVVQHGRDMLSANWGFSDEFNAEVPAEEFLRVARGSVFSWPYCFYNPHTGGLVLAPEYGGDGEAAGRCTEYPDPLVAFPGHWAPNGLLFYDGEQFPDAFRHGAFIAWHGSWNRAPLEQRGYKVTFQPMRDGQPAGDWVVFADGFKGTDHLASPGDAEHRPMGLALAPDGSLYIADSRAGRIWRVFHRP